MKQLILDEFPGAKVEVFGSHRTQLYLPSGDIDMVKIKSYQNAIKVAIDDKIQTYTFQERLKEIFEKQKDYHKLTIIKSARVPIIKVIEKESEIPFDISLNKTEGLDQAIYNFISEINKALYIYPEMKYLIFVLKCFLKQRDFNETYSGGANFGIGSFMLYCMVLAFLRNYRQELLKQGQKLNEILLSEYIIKFFELYGIKFDCSKYLIFLNDGKALRLYQNLLGGSIKSKQDTNNNNFFTLINPLNNEQDLGSASFRIKDIFAIFKNRYNFIVNYNFKINESILKCLLNPCCDEFSCDYA